VAKPSRRTRDRIRAAETAGSSSASGESAGARGSAAGRRGRRPMHRRRGFFDRFGGMILMGFAALGLVALGFLFLQSSTQKAYACDQLLTPGPTDVVPTPTPVPTATPTAATASPSPTAGATSTPGPTSLATATPAPTASPAPTATPAATATPGPTPAPTATAGPTTAPTASPAPTPTSAPTPSPTPVPAPTQRLGFVTADLGRGHIVDQTVHVDYAYCPPGSGPHWNVARIAPVPRSFFEPEQSVAPEQWIHNLEHGFVIQLYSCGADGKSCPSADEMAMLKRIYDEAATSPGATACSVPNKLIVARFDDLATRFAIVAWDRTLLTDTLDVEQSKTFAQQWIDGPAAPEAGACF